MVVLALLAGAPPCASGTIRLDWVRSAQADTCPDGLHVAENVTARLGCDAFGDAPDVRFEVLVRTSSATQWSADIVTRTEDGPPLGRRELHAESCAPLSDAAALTVALMAQSLGVSRATPSPAAAEATSSRDPIRVVTTTVAVERPRPFGRMVTTAGAALNSGTLPEARIGASIGAMWWPMRRFGVGLGALVLPVRRDEIVGLGLVAGWLEGCWAAATGAAQLDVCARGYGGAFFSVVYPQPTIAPKNPGTHGWAAVGALGRLTLALVGPVVAQVEIGAVVPVVRRRFDIAFDDAPNHLESAVALSAGLGFGVRLE